MRKVRLAINVSLDGYVARPNGTLDWFFRTITPAQQAWTTAFLKASAQQGQRPDQQSVQ